MKNALVNTRHLISAVSPKDFPADSGGEVVFAGRSNAGKSSVINKLCGRKNLAKSSKAPGCTRHIQFYQAGRAKRLADLPGYGFARQSRRTQQKWNALIDDYLRQRTSLRCIFLIVDVRRQLMQADRQVIEWQVQAGIPLQIILNKADLLGGNQARNTLQKVMEELEGRQDLTVQLFSAKSGLGAEHARQALVHYLERTT